MLRIAPLNPARVQHLVLVLFTALFITVLFFSPYSFAADETINANDAKAPGKAEQRKQLKTVQQQIKASEKAIENQQIKRKFLNDLLKKSEKQIASVARQLNQASEGKKRNKKKLSELKQEKQQLLSQEKRHKTLLASQLSSMYITGTHDYSKLLLNQQEPGKIERVLGYYQYLNKARTKNIDRIEGVLTRLAQVDQQLVDTLLALTELEQQQIFKKNQLNAHQRNRKQTLVKIRRKLKTESQQLEQLKINEQALAAALQRIKSMTTQAIELLGLAPYKGELGWPVQGKLN
ncbi:MAG: septal ring factor EnvC (AmiA/AmiB activator), partial [Alteromonadaceae bacterium]